MNGVNGNIYTGEGMRNGRRVVRTISTKGGGGDELEIAYELRQFNESNVFPSRSAEWIHDLDTIVASRIGHSCNIHPRGSGPASASIVNSRLESFSPPLLYSIYSSRTRDERDARCLSRRWLCVKGIKSLSRSRLIYHAINVRARKSLAVRA